MLCGNNVTVHILTIVSGATPLPNYTKQREPEYITLDEAIAIWRGSRVHKRTIEEGNSGRQHIWQRNHVCTERTKICPRSSMNTDNCYSDISNDST